MYELSRCVANSKTFFNHSKPHYFDEARQIHIFRLLLQVGFNAGDAKVYYNLPGSNTKGVLNLTNSSNVGVNGRWLFRVDGNNIQLPNAPGLTGR
jgi:Nidogen-like